MRGFGKFFAIAACSLALLATEADAARVGGGKSVGRQSSSVTQSQAAPSSATSPMQQAKPAAAQPAAGAQPQPARNRWLGPLAGIAAGLGLAALASHFGFGEGLASIMLMALVAFAVLVAVRMYMARRAQPRPAFQSGYGQTGIGSEAAVQYSSLPSSVTPGSASSQAFGGASTAPAAAAEPTWRVPADFDAEGFVRNAKVQFIRLQAAFDAGDLADLREFTTPEMFGELKMEISERGQKGNRTDVVQLDGEMLGIETGASDHLASVRFHGLIRESEGAPAQPFDEVWNLEKPVSGSSGWLLAGIQQLN